METTNPATARLTTAKAYDLYIKRVRRSAAIERRGGEVRADNQRIQALYSEGAPRKAPGASKPGFKEASTYTVIELPGGVKASLAAEKAAATRRARRAAR